MKKLQLNLFLLISIFFIGCGVSIEKHHKLQLDYKALQTDYKKLKEKFETLTKTAQFYYQQGIESMNKEDYSEALSYFETVINKFPNNRLVSNAKTKIKKIETISKKNYTTILTGLKNKDLESQIFYLDEAISSYYLKKYELNRIESIKEILQAKFEKEKFINVEDDPIQSARFYNTKRNCEIKDNNSTYKVELNIVEEYKKHRKYFRIKTRYDGKNWILCKKVILRGDNGAQLKINPRSYNIKRNIITGYVGEKTIFKLGKAKEINIRFSGQYAATFKMSDEALKAFKEIVMKYKEIK